MFINLAENFTIVLIFRFIDETLNCCIIDNTVIGIHHI